jgi:5-methylcytosine-specific restriction enzyme A
MQFGSEAYRRIFRHQAAGLRPRNEAERVAVADLVVEPRPAANMWIAIEEDAAKADGGGIDPKILNDLADDLAFASWEGLTEEQKRWVRKRAPWLANMFWRDRWRRGAVTCDECQFDPVARTKDTQINPRSLMDVHHRNPLREGHQLTTSADFQLLCPNCHRYVHAALRRGG